MAIERVQRQIGCLLDQVKLEADQEYLERVGQLGELPSTAGKEV